VIDYISAIDFLKPQLITCTWYIASAKVYARTVTKQKVRQSCGLGIVKQYGGFGERTWVTGAGIISRGRGFGDLGIQGKFVAVWLTAKMTGALERDCFLEYSVFVLR
jgi:hypothetical protein